MTKFVVARRLLSRIDLRSVVAAWVLAAALAMAAGAILMGRDNQAPIENPRWHHRSAPAPSEPGEPGLEREDDGGPGDPELTGTLSRLDRARGSRSPV